MTPEFETGMVFGGGAVGLAIVILAAGWRILVVWFVANDRTTSNNYYWLPENSHFALRGANGFFWLNLIGKAPSFMTSFLSKKPLTLSMQSSFKTNGETFN